MPPRDPYEAPRDAFERLSRQNHSLFRKCMIASLLALVGWVAFFELLCWTLVPPR